MAKDDKKKWSDGVNAEREPSKKNRKSFLGPKIAAGVLVTSLAVAPSVYGQSRPRPDQPDSAEKAAPITLSSDALAQRKKMLDAIQKEPSSSIAARRSTCALGKAPEVVREARSEGETYVPDASESCRLALQRDVRDGKSVEYYERLAEEKGLNMNPADLVDSIAVAAKNNRREVQVGGRSIAVTNPLSFDAGYIEGFRQEFTLASLRMPDTEGNTRQLMTVAEGCLDKDSKNPPPASSCYVAGLALAAKDNSVGTPAANRDATGSKQR
jgi:hypothetical protein